MPSVALDLTLVPAGRSLPFTVMMPLLFRPVRSALECIMCVEVGHSAMRASGD